MLKDVAAKNHLERMIRILNVGDVHPYSCSAFLEISTQVSDAREFANQLFNCLLGSDVEDALARSIEQIRSLSRYDLEQSMSLK
jgi:hypothetical protein